jgi:prefoldin subunit 5
MTLSPKSRLFNVFSTEQTLSFTNEKSTTKPMGNNKLVLDWKFYIQLAVLMVAIGKGIQANSEMQTKVEKLEKSNSDKTEIILRMEGKFDLLNLQIQQLKERLEAKKIVNASLFDARILSGADFITK